MSFVGLNGGGALDPIAMTAWGNTSITSPASQATLPDRTLSWGAGGARNISASLAPGTVISQVEYRINSGTWTNYSTPFALSSGQTLGWRFTTPGANGVETLTITDASRGVQIEAPTCTVSGF